MRLSKVLLVPALLALAGCATANSGATPTSAADCDEAPAPIESDSLDDIEFSTVLDSSLSAGAYGGHNGVAGARFGAPLSLREADVAGGPSSGGVLEAFTSPFGSVRSQYHDDNNTITITYNQLAAVMGIFVGVCLFAGFATARARSLHRQRVTFSPGTARKSSLASVSRPRINTWHAGDLQKLHLDRV